MTDALASEIVRRGETLHVYRRRSEKLAVLLAGVLIFGAATAGLARSLVAEGSGVEKAWLPLGALLLLYGVLAIGFFVVASRVGIETCREGVRSVSFTRKAFVEWDKIRAFLVGHYTPASACVIAELRDGSTVALNGIATWAPRQQSLAPYCDALNRELEERRATVASQ